MLFRAIQELLGNAARHSQATVIKLLVDMGTQAVRVVVDDNGKGFDTDSLKEASSLGLKLIRDRAEMLGGKFEMDSTAGKGTKISFTVPVAAAS
jgi:signal transduction histidine kinase